VVAVATATYLNALGGSFISDDRELIANNVDLQESREIWAWFHRDYYWGSHSAALYGMAQSALALGDRRSARIYASRVAAGGIPVPPEFWRATDGAP